MIEKAFERALFAARWLLAPFFAFLALGLAGLVVRAGLHLWEMARHLLDSTETRVMLDLLALVDLALLGLLVVVVILAGYENFVSRIDAAERSDGPDWMARIGFSELKAKLMSTIVAISAIRLLEAFMEVGKTPDRDLYFLVGLHLTFVASAIGLALSERLGAGRGAQAGH
ncbi:MAG: TIGR00645 family protein [Hyphomicrobiales bacterium]|nr:TIGR00645 family protein [Hyphomicrobiales bacterium]MDE2016689.1 TIGR00645 family protein [Hyphomicrobiales bacterium]